MPEIENTGKILIVVGLAVVVIGVVLLLAGRLPGIGRLPGDILVRRDGVTFFFPLVSCLVLSIILTIVANIIVRFIR